MNSLSGARTKIVAVCIFGVAVLSTLKDLADGGGFNFSSHANDLVIGLNGLGLYFLRDAVSKVEKMFIK